MLYLLIAISIAVSAFLIWLVFGIQKKMDGKGDSEKMLVLAEGQKMLAEQNRTRQERRKARRLDIRREGVEVMGRNRGGFAKPGRRCVTRISTPQAGAAILTAIAQTRE